MEGNIESVVPNAPSTKQNIVISNIQPAPSNLAGATLAAYNGKKTTPPRPIVLVGQGGHWLLTHDTAKAALDAFWISSNRYGI
jgi:hypothetical protein